MALESVGRFHCRLYYPSLLISREESFRLTYRRASHLVCGWSTVGTQYILDGSGLETSEGSSKIGRKTHRTRS